MLHDLYDKLRAASTLVASCAASSNTLSTRRSSFKYLGVKGDTTARDGAGAEGPTQTHYRSGPRPGLSAGEDAYSGPRPEYPKRASRCPLV